MINILTLAITIFSIIMISYKRVNLEILKKLKSLIYNINKQYIDFYKGKKSEFKIWQLIIFIISQVFVVFAIVRRLFEEVYKYVSDNYIVAVKISTYLIIFIILVCEAILIIPLHKHIVPNIVILNEIALSRLSKILEFKFSRFPEIIA